MKHCPPDSKQGRTPKAGPGHCHWSTKPWSLGSVRGALPARAEGQDPAGEGDVLHPGCPRGTGISKREGNGAPVDLD